MSAIMEQRQGGTRFLQFLTPFIPAIVGGLVQGIFGGSGGGGSAPPPAPAPPPVPTSDVLRGEYYPPDDYSMGAGIENGYASPAEAGYPGQYGFQLPGAVTPAAEGYPTVPPPYFPGGAPSEAAIVPVPGIPQAISLLSRILRLGNTALRRLVQRYPALGRLPEVIRELARRGIPIPVPIPTSRPGLPTARDIATARGRRRRRCVRVCAPRRRRARGCAPRRGHKAGCRCVVCYAPSRARRRRR